MFSKRVIDPEVRLLAQVLAGNISSWPAENDARRSIVQLASSHRVDGLIDELARTGQIDLPSDLAAELAGAALRAGHQHSAKDARLIALLETVNNHNPAIQLMALKGWATSLSCYDQRSDRRYTDLDLWIAPRSPASIGAVADILVPSSRTSGRAYDVLLELDLSHNAAIGFKSGLVELHKNPYGLKVDRPGLDAVWLDHARSIELDGQKITVPSSELALAAACVNYARDCFPSLYQLVDIQRLRSLPDFRWPSFWRLCAAQGIEPFAHGALHLSSTVFESPPSPGVVAPRGWRSWWFRSHRVLQLKQPVGARLPAALLTPGGLRATLRSAIRWLLPPLEYWEVMGSWYSFNSADSYATNLRRLYRERLRLARR